MRLSGPRKWTCPRTVCKARSRRSNSNKILIRRDRGRRNEISSGAMKLQASIFKRQGSSKPQAPILRAFGDNVGVWSLKSSWSLRIDAWSFLIRGLALFLGGFCLLNLAGHVWFARFDANLWWIDLHWFPRTVANVFLLIS